jgi:hypothetical protein
VKKNRGLIFLVACIACAGTAGLLAMKFVGKASAESRPQDRVSMLMAAQDITQGDQIVLAGRGGKGNVFFLDWPRNMVPAGAITDKKDVTSTPMRARTSFVKNEAIQSTRLVSEDQYVPADMCWQMVKVGEDDLKNGRLRLGMKVDVMVVNNKAPAPLMKCAQIYAVGRLDDKGLPVVEKDPPPIVWLLIKKADQAAFVEAQYGGGKLVVVEAGDPQCTEPYLVEQQDSAAARKKTADDMVAHAKTLEQAGQYEQALSILDDVVNNFADVSTTAGQAAVEQTKAKEGLAQSLYDRAGAALTRDQDFTGALRLLDELDQQASATSPLRQKAGDLRRQATAALEQHRQAAQYQALIAAIDDALAKGDLPEAQKKLDELTEFSKQAGQIQDAQTQPKDAVESYGKKVKAAVNDFSIKKQALKYFLDQGKPQEAQGQLDDLKKRYPAHPDLPALEETVAAAAAGAQPAH